MKHKVGVRGRFNLPLIYMRHIAQILGQGRFKHIKHPVVKQHIRKHHRIMGRGTQAIKKDYNSEFRGEGIHTKKHLKPLKFKF